MEKKYKSLRRAIRRGHVIEKVKTSIFDPMVVEHTLVRRTSIDNTPKIPIMSFRTPTSVGYTARKFYGRK